MAIVRVTDTDDDGTGTTGTVHNNAWKTAIWNAVDTAIAAGTIQTTTSTGSQNDLTLSAYASVLRCNNATLLTLTGLAAGNDGQVLDIVSVGAGQVGLANQSASSTAANRVINQVTGTISLAAGVGRVRLRYDGTAARWRVLQHEQGAWITRTFAAGNYTASAGTWTVASAGRDAFYLKGRTLFYNIEASGTTSGTPVSVKITLPQSYSAASGDVGASYITNNGADAAEAGYWQAASTQLFLQRLGNASFSAGTVGVNAAAAFELT